MKKLFRSMALPAATVAIALAMTGRVPASQMLAQAAEGGWFPFKIPGLTTGSVTPAAPLPANCSCSI